MFWSSCSPAVADGPRRSLKTESTTASARFPDLLRLLRNRGLLVLALCLGAVVVRAQDATWNLNPTPPTPGDNWGTGSNWTTGNVPTGAARFGFSNGTSITFPVSQTTVGTLQFNAGAPTYTFFLLDNSLMLNGLGIVNNSSHSPIFNVQTSADANFAALKFDSASTAGNATINANSGGHVQFFSSSSAGNATMTVNSAGFVEFFDQSSAGTATFVTNPGGSTEFWDTSSSGHGTFTNSGLTRFNDSSTAGNGTFTNNNGGLMDYCDSSTAGNSTITNNSGGTTRFEDLTTAGNATIITNSGGTTVFFNTSSGGNGHFITNSGGVFDISNLTSGGTTAGSIEGAGTYFLGSKTLTVGGNNLSTEVTGTIVDSGSGGGTGGSLIKVGTGTLTLTGPNSYTGGTTLDAGTLTVNNARALGLGDVTVNGGVLRSNRQPINVGGNYTQTGGTLQLGVAGPNPGQYETLNVGGNARLGGTLQLINLGFKPQAGNQLTLVNTGGVVTGQFGQFVNPFASGPGFTSVELIYGLNSVLLRFLGSGGGPPVVSIIDFTSFALTRNQRAAAGLLDAVQTDNRAANLISFLDKEPFANLPADFDKISPDGLTAFYEITFSNANIQRMNMENRMDDIHYGTNGFSSNMKVNEPPTNPEGKEIMDGKSSKAVVDGKSSKSEPVLQPGPQNRWGVWVTGFGDFVSVDSDGNGKGYDFTTGGVSIGIDYRITEQLTIGIMGEYSHTWTSLQPSGNIDVNSGRGGLYATWFNNGFYLNGAIYGGYNNYSSGRAGLQGIASGNTEGAEWSTFIGGGYDFHFGHLTVGPIAALQYTYAHVDGFTESGSLAPMQIQSDSADSLRSDIGFRVFYQWQVGKIMIEPSFRAAWEHEYLYSALPVTASFAGIPGSSATFFGPAEGHDSAIIGAGVYAQLTPTIGTYLYYDGQLGRQNYSSNAVSGGVRITF